MREMRNLTDIVAGSLCMLSGIGIMIGGIRYKVGTLWDPQPGFFPFVWGIAIIGLSSIIMVKGWLGSGKRARAFGDVWRPSILMMGMIAFAAILEPLGYILATVLVTPFILLVMKVKSLKALILCSFVSAFGSYLLFVYVMHVELPKGILEFIF